MINISRYYIETALENPYHQDPPFNPSSAAEIAALGVIRDLSDRRGFKQTLESLDTEFRVELVASLTATINEAHVYWDELKASEQA